MKYFWVFCLIFLGAFIVFGQLPATFFQQDEWAIFGNYLYWDKAHLSWFTRLFVYEQDTHFIPLANIFSYSSFRLFGLSFSPYAYVSIFLQGIGAFLVFLFFHRLTGKWWLSLLTGFFFLIDSKSHQAITWTATTIGTAGSTLLALLALLSFHRYLVQDRERKWLFISFVLFISSLFFKETSIFLFLFFPLFWLLFAQKKTREKNMRFIFTLVLFGIGYTLLRVAMRMSLQGTGFATGEELSQPSVFVYFFRTLTTPIKVLAQSIAPVGVILAAARFVVRLGYPQFLNTDGVPDPFLVETVASDITSFSTSIALLSFFTILCIWDKQVIWMRKLLILSFGFIALSSLPFIIIPGKAGYISLLDGRHLYITSIFSSFLVAVAFSVSFQLLKKYKLGTVAVVSVLILFVFYHGRHIQRDIARQVVIGNIRQSLLKQIVSNYPLLPQRVVFYMESDTAYYGLDPHEYILPFQSGLGQTLLVWYNATEQFPGCLFRDKYLYRLTSQDYKVCDGRGFGYFRDINKLREVAIANRLSPESIIAFSFHGGTNELTDITPQIREKLQEQ